MAEKHFEKQRLRHLARIENELEEIKERTGNPKRAFFYGILYGAGAFVGGAIAIIFIGWVLFVLGLIPGFESFEKKLSETYDNVRGR